jgi:hypothetical protein
MQAFVLSRIMAIKSERSLATVLRLLFSLDCMTQAQKNHISRWWAQRKVNFQAAWTLATLTLKLMASINGRYFRLRRIKKGLQLIKKVNRKNDQSLR